MGATLAAVQGLGETLVDDAKLILIAGGQAKGQQFGELKAATDRYLRSLILIGEDANLLANDLAFENTLFAESITDAVRVANEQACAGDLVLLSPACASFDMFKGFEDRGRQYVAAVSEVAK